MCGVTGLFSPVASAEARFERLRRMTRALEHRGPDAEGFFFDPAVPLALGHRRLAIVDLDDRSTQPMVSGCGRFVLAFNGEIYNFVELRERLLAAGVSLRTESDTEVLLEWVARFGFESALEVSVGMFAIAVFDRKEGVLRLARDRLGKKPLHYGFVGKDFVFASEVSAFEAAYPGLLRPDREAFALLARYSFIPAPFSVYRGFRKLEPGSFVETTFVELTRGEMPKSRRFWSLDDAIARGSARRRSAGNLDELTNETERELSEAVRIRLRSDVPLGAFLSGGIDSSLVVALMTELSTSRVRTFSIGFGNRDFDESKDAERVAVHLGTAHTEFVVTPEDVGALAPELATLYDEPFADSSALPTTLVSRLAKKHVTVVLTGDGGDEVFAGYNRHVWGKRVWAGMEPLSPDFRAELGSLVSRVSPEAYTRAFDRIARVVPKSLRVRSLGDKLHKLARVAGARDPEELHRALASHFLPEDGLFREATPEPSLDFLEARGAATSLSSLERALRFDTLLGLPADMLVKVDRATMSVGLEARQPLLDHRLVEHAWTLPEGVKYRNGVGKWVLREVLAKRVPRAMFERPKMGFGVPIGEWLRGPLREFAEERLAPARLDARGLFAADVVARLWKEHLSGALNADSRLWSVLMAEAWLEKRNLSF